jgi:type II secretory pathway predicted ATPase ExeA
VVLKVSGTIPDRQGTRTKLCKQVFSGKTYLSRSICMHFQRKTLIHRKPLCSESNMHAALHANTCRCRTPLKALMSAAAQENKATYDRSLHANAVQLLMKVLHSVFYRGSWGWRGGQLRSSM